MKVSIITIVYNNCGTIADCIRSVQNQTYKDIEHIIIDGGSTDGTQEVIEHFRDKLAYYHSEKDEGLYDALNKGIRQATGDIVGILHADDLHYEHKTIEKIVHKFQKTGADLIYANGQYVDRHNTSKVRRTYTSKPFRKVYLHMGWIPLHTTIYVRREVFDKYGLYHTDFEIASDYSISLRWFTNDEIKKVFFDEWVVKMRLGGKSTTPSLQRKKSEEDLRIIRHYKLLGFFTLGCKITRKIPQYLVPHIRKF